MRLAVGAYTVCTNSFSHEIIDVARCQAAMRAGEAALGPHRRRRTAISGVLDIAAQAGIDIVPLSCITPGLGRPVTQEAQAWVNNQFRHALQAIGPVDGVFLQLHGGGTIEGDDDPDQSLFATLRDTVGEQTALMATLDGHANLTSEFVRLADLLVAVKTNPHYDFFECGQQVAQVMIRALSGTVKPIAVLAQPPMLPSLQKQRVAPGWPMENLVRRGLNHMCQDARILDVTTIGGWPYADASAAGPSVLVTTDGEPGLAQEVAESLHQIAWEQRHQFEPHITPLSEAVREAMETDAWPMVLGDVSDSGGAGTTGDGTAILRELLEQGAQDAVIGHLMDPDAVVEAVRAGVGQTVSLSIGGKQDDRHGSPVHVKGKVRSIHDGDFVTSTPFNSGRQRRGTTVRLACEGIDVILTSNKAHSFEPNTFRSVGIEPSEQRILVAESEMQHRAGMETVGRTFIDVDTPGISTPVLSRLPYQQLRRPIFPLDVI